MSHHPPLSREEREGLVAALARVMAETPPVLFAYLFGSVTQGLAFEDVDVAVYLAEDVQDGLAVALGLAADLERATGLPVDVTALNDAPIGVALAAAQGEVVFCRDPRARLAFLEHTALRAMDTRYLRRQSVRDLLGIPPR
ncbi:MAG: nucleotidyltransferase domain-containing protein [Armatimonadota bacterium]|nr:nucleotidyltransferase domain-containing protein [Armatimonadota bacterium]MDR7410180.1 nucleotidyltransferase domain-containing protein [Armatimonadota bacterium]